MTATRRRVVTVLALAAGFGVVWTLVALRWSPLLRLDVGLDARLNHFFGRHGGAASAARAVSNAGQPAVFETLSVLGAVVLWVRRHLRLALFTLVTAPVSSSLSNIVKALVGRHRPHVHTVLSTAGGSSFPSGHTTASLAGVGVLVVVWAALRLPHLRLVAVVATTVAVLVAFSRLALGVHYLSDVVGGWLLALLWLLTACMLFGVRACRTGPAHDAEVAG